MNELLEKLLEKRGLTITELEPEEQAQIKRWQSILSGKEVKISDVESFCNVQIDLIESQFDNIDNTREKNDRLVFLHSIYRKMRKLVTDTNKQSRERIEAELTAMIYEE